MTRHLLYIILAVLGALPCQAGPVHLGLHAGEGFASVRQNYASALDGVTSLSLTPGNRLTIGANAAIDLSRRVQLGTALDLAVANYRCDLTRLAADNNSLVSITQRNRMYGLEIPVYVSYTAPLGAVAAWRSELGAYLDFGLGGHSNISGVALTGNPLGQVVMSSQESRGDYYNNHAGVINRISAFDWGLHMATGIVIARHWSVMANVHIGARDVARNFGVYDTRVHNLSFTATAGYTF